MISWLLDSDPSIRWQVLQDLMRGPADEVRAEHLDYLHRAGVVPDERASEAIDLVASKRDTTRASIRGDRSGGVKARQEWPLGARDSVQRQMPVETGEQVGAPSRWITLRALRVLEWYEQRPSAPETT